MFPYSVCFATLCIVLPFGFEGGLIDFFVGFVTSHFANGVLQHGILLEEVVHGNFAFKIVMHRALEEEAQEALRAAAAGRLLSLSEAEMARKEKIV